MFKSAGLFLGINWVEASLMCRYELKSVIDEMNDECSWTERIEGEVEMDVPYIYTNIYKAVSIFFNYLAGPINAMRSTPN